ncbi:uncharacterized protein LOC126836577 [Adelges cooleyi]|uniref:uncharacterized protein LOC126836577 n=1 Tax=Adelges cooleyi TaxID=133065 RepID=UPI00217F9B1F|nr:uncharacterized protein LOC126836577 [Adelges cooleyi]
MGNAVRDNGRWSRFVVVSSSRTTCSCAAVDAPPPPPRSQVLVLVVVVVVLLCVDFVTCTSAAAADGQSFPEPPARRPDLAELRHNIIKGLKLDKLPDMTKVEIGNDEFHCKYLEYFRRLYMDEDEYSPAAGYDNDVSAIQVQGQVKREPAAGSGNDGRAWTTEYVTFPVHWKLRHTEDSAIIRAVVRLYGKRVQPHGAAPVRVHAYGRLYTTAAGSLAVTESVADIAWPARGRDDGRWLDVDVTEMLRRPRDRRNGTLELSVRASDASVGFGHRTPVLHVFLNGVDVDDVVDGTAAVACAGGDVRKRRRRDSGGVKRPLQTTFPTDGGGAGRRRRTDCKPAAPPVDDKTAAATASNRSNATVTEHNNKCCREEMRVVFADIPGFDFIIEPKWFDAGLCRGRCPAKYNPATRHAFIQSLLWKQHAPRRQQQETEQAQRYGRHRMRHGGKRDGGDSAAAQPPPPPKPCCAPSKLDRLQIVHIDELNPTNLKVTTWKEMAVVECACS